MAVTFSLGQRQVDYLTPTTVSMISGLSVRIIMHKMANVLDRLTNFVHVGVFSR